MNGVQLSSNGTPSTAMSLPCAEPASTPAEMSGRRRTGKAQHCRSGPGAACSPFLRSLFLSALRGRRTPAAGAPRAPTAPAQTHMPSCRATANRVPRPQPDCRGGGAQAPGAQTDPRPYRKIRRKPSDGLEPVLLATPAGEQFRLIRATSFDPAVRSQHGRRSRVDQVADDLKATDVLSRRAHTPASPHQSPPTPRYGLENPG